MEEEAGILLTTEALDQVPSDRLCVSPHQSKQPYHVALMLSVLNTRIYQPKLFNFKVLLYAK